MAIISESISNQITPKNIAFIDGQNLHLGLNWEPDYNRVKVSSFIQKISATFIFGLKPGFFTKKNHLQKKEEVSLGISPFGFFFVVIHSNYTQDILALQNLFLLEQLQT